MTTRDIFIDLSRLVHPMPTAEQLKADNVPDDVRGDIQQDCEDARQRHEDNLRHAWEADNDLDPLLSEIASARSAKLTAERRMRELIAYGREFVKPRPYRLEDLAHAAGMSISGIRTTYGEDEIRAVAQATGAKRRREW